MHLGTLEKTIYGLQYTTNQSLDTKQPRIPELELSSNQGPILNPFFITSDHREGFLSIC